jgi:GDPmannose 4,6-dehydratase
MSAMPRRALVTGISGQDGALLASLLLRDGIEVVGTHRPAREVDAWRLHGLGIAGDPRLRLADLEPADAEACAALVKGCAPDQVFHLAGQSRVAESFRDPRASLAANGASTVNLLEALRAHAPAARFVLAASAEVFGSPVHAPQDESTPLAARTPYGVSKLLARSAHGARATACMPRARSCSTTNRNGATRRS